MTRFDMPYPARSAPSEESGPRVFDLETVGPAPAADPPEPPADPEATTTMRRSDIVPDGPEDAA